MLDLASWQNRICDVCRKDESLQPRFDGIMEQGLWIDGFSEEKSRKVTEILGKWERELTCPCVVFQKEIEEFVICEKHLAEIVSNKSKYMNQQ